MHSFCSFSSSQVPADNDEMLEDMQTSNHQFDATTSDDTLTDRQQQVLDSSLIDFYLNSLF